VIIILLYLIRSELNSGGSFLGLFGDNSPLLDFYFFDVLAETVLDGLDDVGLVSLEGEEVLPSSDFELGDCGVLLYEDSCIT
jgi:hypothetical protein